jgi:hypothetical protein
MFAFVALATVFAITAASLSAQIEVQAIPAKRFVESMGVNLHMEYTDSGYADVAAVQTDLAYLGIKFVRDNIPEITWGPAGQGVAAIHAVASRDIKFNICVRSPDLSYDLNQLLALETFHPGMIASVEGPNEINNSPFSYQGLQGQSAADQFQKDLFRSVRTTAKLRTLPVYYFTGGQQVTGPSLTGQADFANAHPYPRSGEPPRHWLIGDFQNDYTNLGSIPKVITETGYYTLPSSSDWGGVDDVTQAKLLLTTYFAAAQLGIYRTYVYQLLDAYADSTGADIDKHFGFFDVDNVAKPSAVAIHNLTRYLNDSETGIQRSLRYTLTGLPSTGYSLLLSKSDDSFVLAVWNEVQVWDESRKEPVQSPSITAQLCLPRRATLQTFDPLTRATETIAKTAICSAINVADHPTLISIKENQ